LVAGAGGFIGGHLVRYLADRGWYVRAADKKPLPQWWQRDLRAESLCLDLAVPENCHRACEGVQEVYHLAADMGGIGFISHQHVACLRNILITAHLLESAWRAGAESFFYASSACVYPTTLQQDPAVRALKEEQAYPALCERGYGWEKLLGEMFCQEYWHDRGLKTFIARFHNVYGPHGSWNDGREKAPAAICRKVAEALRRREHEAASSPPGIEIWGDGTQTRSFLWIGDCLEGIQRITQCDRLIATPVNLGSSECVTINRLVELVEQAAGLDQPLPRIWRTDAPRGVAGRNSDNTLLREMTGWEPATPLAVGLKPTYAWIARQVWGA
jgi:nucleoside-diphosphate-sugar epimerase